jgi:hypothetical protein
LLTITRKLAEQLRKVFRQALSTNSRCPMPPVEFAGNRFGLRVRCHTQEAAVEFRLDDDQPEETILAPWDLLTDTGGSGRERVVELRRENGHVLASWQNGSVPRAVQYATPVENEAPWPDSPERFVENPLELLKALAEAAATSDDASSRYALGCLQLCGGGGKIVATDGHHLLMQRGFEFPWEGDILVPASRVFGSAQVDASGPVFIGKTEDWFTLQAGQWTFWLKINQNGRFPTVEQHIGEPEAAVASVELPPSDRRFLAENLPHMPGDGLVHSPVTLDLNGTVAVRARGQEAENVMEMVLTGATCHGESIRMMIDRRYLARAAKLGFERLHIFGDKQPMLAADGSRSYAWAVLDAKSCIEPAENMTRIESPLPGRAANVDPPRSSSIRRTNTPMPRSFTTNNDDGNGNGKAHAGNGHANGHANGNGNGHAGSEPDNGQTSGAIEQVIALRTTLREATAQATELVRLLKAEKRQTRQLRSALSSLRELQPLEL